ncbi:hypothetical protein [Nocardia niwae]|uniref:hypothetical protein n=1 Tax=Nocardia niwae TaxID=626084 RepID=UPI001C3F8017|nr:hypothetical protein [Nocardia niwae]
MDAGEAGEVVRHLRKRIRRDPGRVLFIDDRADNCRAAAHLGLHTLHYTGSPADIEIHLRSTTVAA